MDNSRIVFERGSRDSLELRGHYLDHKARIRVCMVYGSGWLDMKPTHELTVTFSLRRDDMNRQGYESSKLERDPDWDADTRSIEGERHYVSEWAYFKSAQVYDYEDPWQELKAFQSMPPDLQAKAIDVVEQDSHGSFSLSRSGLELGVAKRIFWVGDPVQRIQERLALAHATLVWAEQATCSG